MSHLYLGREGVGSARCSNGRPGFHLRRKLVGRAKAAEDGGRSDRTLSTLDSLLGSDSESDALSSADSDPNLVEWWRIRPRQAAPPRTTSISSSANPGGRFIANEAMLRNEVRAGRKTLPGEALELPKVAPYESYILALIHAAVYGTLVRVYATQGADAASELFEGLGLSRAAVVDQVELWRLLSGCFVQADLMSLAVVLYGMLVVAPRVEASLGNRTFVAAYTLSAIVAADVLLAFTSASTTGGGIGAAVQATGGTAAATVTVGNVGLPSGLLEAVLLPGGKALATCDPGLLCGGLGAVMGLAGSSLAHQIINGDVERQASGSNSSSSGGSSIDCSGGAEGVGDGPASVGTQSRGLVVDVRTGVLLMGAAVVALQHALEPGGVLLAAALGAGFGTGFLLSSVAGPRYQVTREVELPDGSMWIPHPESVTEVTVVLDQTTSIRRTLATLGLASVISIATLAVVFGSRQ